MVGIASNQLRSAFVAETTPGTTPSTPGFKTLHSPAIFTNETLRFHQESLVSGGSFLGDTLLDLPSVGKIEGPIVYSAYDQIWETLFQDDWTADVITDGKKNLTVTVENSIEAGVGGTRTYIRHRGVQATGAKLEMNAKREVRFSMDLIGMAASLPATSAISGATYSDPVNDDPLSAWTDVTGVTLAGYTLDGISSMTVDFTYAKREPQPQLGSKVLAGVSRGAFQPKITMKVYKDTNFKALMDAAMAETQTAQKLTINMGSVTLKKYKFEFHKCYIDMAQPDYSGANAFLDVTLTPRYSASDGCVMTLTRALV